MLEREGRRWGGEQHSLIPLLIGRWWALSHSCSWKLLRRFWQKAFAHLCGPSLLVERGPIHGSAWDKGGCLLTSVPMCVLVCTGARTWCQLQIWAAMGSLHTPVSGHCVSAAGSVPMGTKPHVPTAVPSAFFTLQDWHTENRAAAGAAADVHMLLAAVSLCTSSHLGQAHPPTFGLEPARACPARRVHARVSTAPAPSEGAL